MNILPERPQSTVVINRPLPLSSRQFSNALTIILFLRSVSPHSYKRCRKSTHVLLPQNLILTTQERRGFDARTRSSGSFFFFGRSIYPSPQSHAHGMSLIHLMICCYFVIFDECTQTTIRVLGIRNTGILKNSCHFAPQI